MCLSKDRQLNQYWKKVALTACFYVRAATMDYHAPPCPCQLPNLLFKKKNVVFKVTVPHSLSILFVLGKARYNTDHKVLKYTGGPFSGQLSMLHCILKFHLIGRKKCRVSSHFKQLLLGSLLHY